MSTLAVISGFTKTNDGLYVFSCLDSEFYNLRYLVLGDFYTECLRVTSVCDPYNMVKYMYQFLQSVYVVHMYCIL